jgi:hypothetical protein
LDKTGRELKGQKRRFRIEYFFNEDFEICEEPNVKNQSLISKYYHLLISNIETHHSTFYIIGDKSVGPTLGEITRYKFQMDSLGNLNSIRLIEKKIIAVR